MKTCILALVSMLSIASADALRQQMLCGCKPAPPICASNYHTYNGICEMGCDRNYPYLYLYKLYDGPCFLDGKSSTSPGVGYPSRKNLAHNHLDSLVEQHQGNNLVELMELARRRNMLEQSHTNYQ